MRSASAFDDEELCYQLSQGQMQAGAVLFERYQGPMYNFFIRQCRRQSLAEDLTQQVFERMLRYRQSYVPGMAFRSWLYQIARNVRHDNDKRERRYRSSEFVATERIRSTADVADDSLLKKEQNQQLQIALGKLKPEEREVLLLTRYQQLKYREVAEIYGITESAVKVRVHRAIKELRRLYFKLDPK